MEQLLRVLGDDFRYVEPVYCGPELKTFPDGSVEGYFGRRLNRLADPTWIPEEGDAVNTHTVVCILLTHVCEVDIPIRS